MKANRGGEDAASQHDEASDDLRLFQHCIAALGGSSDIAALVLDDRGRVVFCNAEASAMFGQFPRDLLGKGVHEFIRDIRLNQAAPASNVAYAAHMGRNNRWQPYDILDAQGKASEVELMLDVAVVDLHYLILLWARRPSSADGHADRRIKYGLSALSESMLPEPLARKRQEGMSAR
jgi:hypothetical protein